MTEDDTTPDRGHPVPSTSTQASAELQLSATALSEIVEKKVTCPFLGSAVGTGQLVVRNDAANPLASIEDVRGLGNTGGGDLGNLLMFFAAGNHAFMRGQTGRLDQQVPEGLFSLELPGSQGSHPGHSGVLQGDPETLNSGRFSPTDFARLASHANNGLLKRSEAGQFIAENLHRDPKAKVFEGSIAGLLADDLVHFVASVGPDLLRMLGRSGKSEEAAHRDIEQKLTKLMGEENLIGSAGEFGLMFAFLAKKPGASEVDGEPAISLEDLRSMFENKRFPEGWKSWKKMRLDWIINTTSLAMSAGKAYLALQRRDEKA
jgi:hypothetical protein